MKKTAFIALSKNDLEIIKERCSKNRETPNIIVLNNDLYKKSIDMRFEKTKYINPQRDSLYDQSSYLADFLARRQDKNDSDLRIKYLGYKHQTLGWGYLNYFFSFYGVLRFKEIIPSLIEQLEYYETIYIVDFRGCSNYYDDSKLRRQIIEKELKKKCENLIYINEIKLNKENNESFYCKRISGKFRKRKNIIHLPTHFYQFKEFYEVFNVQESSCLDIESLKWDIKINSNRLYLVEDSNPGSRYEY